MKILIQKKFVCYHVVYSRRYFDSVHYGLQTCTEDSQNICQFYRATRTELFFFCSRKMFTSRKFTGVEILLQFFFNLNEKTNICTLISENSDCISHPKTQKYYVYIYIYIICLCFGM